jgi:hypothetical protein
VALEKRTTPRQRTLKKGRIVFNDGRSTIECAVRNLSAGGAKLEVTSSIGVPNDFDLLMADGSTKRCRVAWRKLTEIGVSY